MKTLLNNIEYDIFTYEETHNVRVEIEFTNVETKNLVKYIFHQAKDYGENTSYDGIIGLIQWVEESNSLENKDIGVLTHHEFIGVYRVVEIDDYNIIN